MASDVNPDELKKIPFLDQRESHSGRIIPTLHFYVEEKWHAWMLVGNELHPFKSYPLESNYLGDKPERPTDQFFRILDLIAQHTFNSRQERMFNGLWNDFQGLAATLSKITSFFECHCIGKETRRMVQTEVEYIVFVCRSIYDLLQELVCDFWNAWQIEGKKTNNQLKSSFREMVMWSNKARSAKEISEKYRIPKELAKWYESETGFFLKLRELRDRIVHSGGTSVELIFCTDEGFGIDKNQKPFCDFYEWHPESIRNNGIVPLRPVLCNIVARVIGVCESFAELIRTTVELPPPLCPNLYYFSRGLHDLEFYQLREVIKSSMWCKERIIPPEIPKTVMETQEVALPNIPKKNLRFLN